MPQLRFQSDPDLGSYWRCRLNGGGDLVCRFFAGLPPFTIGGVVLNVIEGPRAPPRPYSCLNATIGSTLEARRAGR
jgi:hypothetical protein